MNVSRQWDNSDVFTYSVLEQYFDIGPFLVGYPNGIFIGFTANSRIFKWVKYL